MKLYNAGKFLQASLAFKASLDVESDTETIFALAQSNRQIGKCKAANTYYDMLLEEKSLPEANRQAILSAKQDCVESLNEGGDDPDGSTTEGSGSGSVAVVVDRQPRPVHHWYLDPAGDTLTGLGAATLVAGLVMLSASNSEYDKLGSQTVDTDYLATKDRAQRDYDISLGCFIGGGILLVSGVSWYLSHTGDDAPPRKHRRTVTGWVRGDGGGLSVIGSF